MAWRRPGDKPISEPMLVSLTHICVTRPQWVNNTSSSTGTALATNWCFIFFPKLLPSAVEKSGYSSVVRQNYLHIIEAEWRISLIRIMVCRLFDAKPLSKPIVNRSLENRIQWNLIETQIPSMKETDLKMSSAKWRSFCLDLNMLKRATRSNEISQHLEWLCLRQSPVPKCGSRSYSHKTCIYCLIQGCNIPGEEAMRPFSQRFYELTIQFLKKNACSFYLKNNDPSKMNFAHHGYDTWLKIWSEWIIRIVTTRHDWRATS